MGLFDKKNCDICGDKIGLLGNRKLDDGNLCKKCAGKLSPWFEERRHSTVEDIKRQLAYREENQNAVRNFRVTREFSADRYHVFIDDNKGMFAVAFNMREQDNPDIVPLSAITSCRMEIEEEREEEEYTDQDGNSRSYVPPRYNYSYDYKIKLGVNTPWFDDMDFKLNTFSVRDHERAKMMKYEQLGNQIISALTGTPAPAPIYGNGMMNQGYPQQSGMMNQGYPQQSGMMNQGYPQRSTMMNQNSPQQGTMMNQNTAPQASGDTWVCSCGATNRGRFCEYCGTPKP